VETTEFVVFLHSIQFAGFPLWATKNNGPSKENTFRRADQCSGEGLVRERRETHLTRSDASWDFSEQSMQKRKIDRNRRVNIAVDCRCLSVRVLSFAVSFLCPIHSFHKDNVDECIKITCIVYLPNKSPLLLTPPLSLPVCVSLSFSFRYFSVSARNGSLRITSMFYLNVRATH
jgi:hypothetical protein